MANDPRPRREDDADFNEWLQNRQPPPEHVPASVAFMEMMRQAAAQRPTSTPPHPGTFFESVADTPGDAPPLEPDEPVEASPGEKAAVPVRRVRRARRSKPKRKAVGALGGFIRSLIVILAASGLTATIFTLYTPIGFLAPQVREELSVALATSVATVAPTPLLTPPWERRIGIVSGHRGPENDPGAVCPDGLTEAEINFDVAQQVVLNLRGRGYNVDLLDEFDARLNDYQAAALVSIHANTCQVWPGGEVVSGYLIAGPAARVTARGNDQLLVECVARYYEAASGLQRREGLTIDMTDYHSFREIHPLTPAAILELGFMLADRAILTENSEALASGITEGILCFLEPGRAGPPTPGT